MITVKLPRRGVTPEVELERICDIIQHAPELGFVFKAVVLDAISQNDVRGTLWAVYDNEEPVGVAMIGSRRPYDHVYRTGDVAVVPERRRQRFGTCLYTATAMQGILEGRREVEETVIASLSPWMVYSAKEHDKNVATEIGIDGMPNFDGLLRMNAVDGDGFLRSLGYTWYGTLPKRTGGFRDIQLWCHSPFDIDDYLERLPEDDVVIELADREHDWKVYDRNIENYKKHDMTLATRAERLKTWVLEGADGLVRIV